METETESGNGKWKRKAEKGNGRHSNTYSVDRSSSSKSRSASLGRCKTWTHELTDIWTPDKAINDDNDTYAMYPTMPLQCSVSGPYAASLKGGLHSC